jgi:hypothetical protein
VIFEQATFLPRRPEAKRTRAASHRAQTRPQRTWKNLF